MTEVRARVVTQERGLYRIQYEGQIKKAEISGRFRFDATSPSDYPTVGDYVIAAWPEEDSNAIISMIFPRKSCFKRKASGQEMEEQLVAANIDIVFLCMSLNNDFNLRRMERYLAVAGESGAEPVILLTKKDLCNDFEERLKEVEQCAPDKEIIALSAFDESSDRVYEVMEKGKTYALIGSSGVGKSTLINKLLRRELLKTDGLRNDDKGHHTTTHREMIELENGAFVIDTPGMRELGMWDSENGIESVFSDVESWISQCRFSTCRHETEPGCAVRQALRDGRLSQERWNSYLKLKNENSYMMDQRSYRKAKKEKFKEIAMINKRNSRHEG